jgi:hypothetical protein
MNEEEHLEVVERLLDNPTAVKPVSHYGDVE